jgi:hypothetical protein
MYLTAAIKTQVCWDCYHWRRLLFSLFAMSANQFLGPVSGTSAHRRILGDLGRLRLSVWFQINPTDPQNFNNLL